MNAESETTVTALSWRATWTRKNEHSEPPGCKSESYRRVRWSLAFPCRLLNSVQYCTER